MTRAPLLTDDEREQAIAMYQAGLSIGQTAERMRRSPYAIRCALVDADIPRRSPRGPKIPAAERAEMVRLYAEGLSTHAIAQRLGHAQNAVWQILTHSQVPMRAPGWPKNAHTRHQEQPCTTT